MSVTEIGDRTRKPGDEEVIDEAALNDKLSEPEPEDARSIEDRAKAGEHEEEDDGTPQLVLPGTGSKLSNNVGGKRPQESMFKMSGTQLPIAGGVQMDKDTEVWVAVRVAIDDVQVKNKRKDESIVSTKRVHTGTILGQPIIMDGPPAGYEG